MASPVTYKEIKNIIILGLVRNLTSYVFLTNKNEGIKVCK